MAHVKNYCVKFVLLLFCLSQVQGGSRLLSEKADNPFEEFIREISKSANRISEKLQSKLNEADIHVEKYVGKLKDNVELSNEQIQEFLQKVEESLEKFCKQVNEVIPKTIDKLVEEIKTKDPETAEKIKKLRVEVIQLKEDLIKVYEEIKKPLLQHFNELKEDVITKTKPIVKRWTPIVKDIEDIILALITDKKNTIQKK